MKPTGFNSSTTSALRLIISLAVQSAALTAIVAVTGAILSLTFNGDDLMTTDIAYAFWSASFCPRWLACAESLTPRADPVPLPALYALSLFTTLSVPAKVERRLRGVSTAYSFTRSSGVDKAAHAPEAVTSNITDGVSVHVELWVEEEMGGLETEEGERSEEDRMERAGPAKMMDVAPRHLCPQ